MSVRPPSASENLPDLPSPPDPPVPFESNPPAPPAPAVTVIVTFVASSGISTVSIFSFLFVLPVNCFLMLFADFVVSLTPSVTATPSTYH